MQNYKTVEEKAAEWDISSRHVQYLCRNGRVNGAVKHAGVWFIPGDTLSPAKNSKSGRRELSFVGTKNRIFDSAIELFLLRGFENVSLRDIANSVGIRQSTIYNHFGSKQEILDTIYNFYSYYYLRERPDLKDMAARLKNESLTDIIGYIGYEFDEEYRQKMSDITKLIFQRFGIDDRAREIGKALMVNEGVSYVEDVFNMGIESGRFAPFDTHLMAVFINSIRIFTLYSWILDPSPGNMTRLREDEQALYGHAAGLVKDLTR